MYFIEELLNFSKVIILTVINIKKGFNISIGCKLKNKSLSTLAPFTSIPNTGTNAKKRNDKKNNGTTSFVKTSVFITEIVSIIIKARKVNVRCFVKKNSNLYLIFLLLKKMLRKMKKISLKKKNQKLKSIFLSIFLQ